MERINYNNLLHTLLIVLLSGMMWGCVDDGVFDIPGKSEGNKRVEGNVIVSLKIPTASNNPTTRANSLSGNDANAINEITVNANVLNVYAVSTNVINANVLNEIEVNTFNVDEDAVTEIAVLLFDSNGYTYQPIYISSSNMTFNNNIIESFIAKIPVGTYNMVILVNANKSLSKALQYNKIKVGDSKTEVLKQLLFSNPYDDTSDSPTIAKWDALAIPMWGEALNVQVNGDGPVSVGVIELVRMVAKVDVELTAAAATNFTLKSVRLYNYNTLAQVAPNTSNWQGEPSIPVSPGKVKGPLVYTATDATSCTNKIYAFEAKAGSANSLPTSTCLVIGVTKNMETTYHRIDFANILSDETRDYLSLLRNHHYRVNIVDIRGQGYTTPEEAFDSPSIETGIIVPQPESNSYIMALNSDKIYIPVSRANQSILGNQLSTGDVFTASLVWTDNVNKISPNSNIKSVNVEGTGPTGYLVVERGAAQGNAVVAIKNSVGKILWSWHIWVTNDTPTAIGKFMDRNLGAIGNTPGAVATKGLLYQWGRKDPFPGSTALEEGGEPTIYNATGATSIAKVETKIKINFPNSVEKPATFYFGNNAPYDWYTNVDSEASRNNKLWDDGTNTKTIYDPCPEGWRVPKNGVWDGLSTSNFIWGDYGRSVNTHGGFYPAAGYRFRSNGSFYVVGSNGYYWSATVTGRDAYNLHFTSNYFRPSYISNRAYGFSVRCVRDE